jgi:hypothetical protein
VGVNEEGGCERGVGVCQVMVEVKVLANEEVVVEARAHENRLATSGQRITAVTTQ